MSYLEIILLGIMFNFAVSLITVLFLVFSSEPFANTRSPQLVFLLMEINKLNSQVMFLRQNINSINRYRLHELLPFVSIIFVFKILLNMIKSIHPLQTLLYRTQDEVERLEKLYKEEHNHIDFK